MKIGFIFSGQGSQYHGMGYDLYQEYPIFKEYVDIASNQLNFDMAKLLFDEDERLHQTKYTQPAVLTMSCATSAVLKKELGITPDLVAGLSLGEYSALVENQTISFSDAVSLVYKRGELMADAVPTGQGAMAAVIGLDRKVIENICKKLSKSSEIVLPVNYNTPSQIVIAGNKSVVELAQDELINAGAKKVVSLNVSGPFHTPLLSHAAEKFSIELDSIEFLNGVIPFITNVSGELFDTTTDIKGNLTKQMMSPVYWEETIRTFKRETIDTLVEIGPGKTLSQFVRSIDRELNVQHVENKKTLDQLEKKLAKWGN
ncbi:ACP S-malonyltransferase [Vagococcus sp. JNUCC 83]